MGSHKNNNNGNNIRISVPP